MPVIKHGQSGTAAHLAWIQNKARNKLDSRWLDFNQMYADVGDPPEKGMRITRMRKSEILGPDNWRWRLHERIEQGEFMRTVLKIIKANEPITVRDIRSLLIEDYGESQSLLHNAVHIHCMRLVKAGHVERTEERILSRHTSGGNRAYGYRIPAKDDRKVLWVIRNSDFKFSNIKPHRILYDATKPIAFQLVGKYKGVDRLPVEPQSKEYYEAKGWRVIEL
jgi:hypothetical protein